MRVNPRHWLIGLLVCLCLGSGVAIADTGPAMQQARAYFNLLHARDFKAAAALYDKDALAEFRKLMGFVTEIPPEVQTGFLRSFFGPQATPAAVAALPNDEFFSAFFGAAMKRAEMATGNKLSFDKMELLGQVDESPALTHIVTRNRVSFGEVTLESMEVLSLRRIDGNWKVLLSGKLRGLPLQLKRAIERSTQRN